MDFKESIIQIDKILLPMRDISNLLLKKSITRALRFNSNHAQELVSTHSATKHVVEILDAKYVKADNPAIVRENSSHLSATDREKLLSMLLKYELLFNSTLGDWNLPPVSIEVKEGMKPYHGRAYLIPHIPQIHTHERGRQAMQNWGVDSATIIKVGIAIHHYTQKGSHGLYNFHFQGTK